MLKIGIDYGLVNCGYCIIYNNKAIIARRNLNVKDQYNISIGWVAKYIVDEIVKTMINFTSNKYLEDTSHFKINLEDYNFYKPNTNSKQLCQLVALIKFYFKNKYRYPVFLVNSSFTKRFVDVYKQQISKVLEMPYNRNNSHVFDAFAIANYMPKQRIEKYQAIFDDFGGYND